MILTIVRHAIAVPRGTPGFPNDDRPLTSEGRARMKKAARGLRSILDPPERIYSSPLSRARETATIISAAYGSTDILSETDVLLPGTPPQKLFEALQSKPDVGSIMIVGHEPDLSTVAALLLGSHHTVITFKKGGAVCVDVERFPPRPHATLLWMLPPRILRALS